MEKPNNKEKASYYFHHPDFRFNCAQAITHKWGCKDNLVAEMKKCGGGRAADGNCGALHGALMVLQEKELKERMLDLFAEKAGSNSCIEIKKAKKTSCQECVDIADQLLHTFEEMNEK